MSVVVRFLHEWFYEFDEEHSKGVRKSFPVGMVQTLEEDIAAAAIAKGAAEPLAALTEEMQALVELHRLYQAGYEPDEIAALVHGGDPSDDDPAILRAQIDERDAEIERLRALLTENGLDPGLAPSFSPLAGGGEGEGETAAGPVQPPAPSQESDEVPTSRRKRAKRKDEAEAV